MPTPAELVDRVALRVSLDPSPEGEDAPCPVTVDLYTDDLNRVDAVSLYSGTSSGDPAG
ncbi:hypothetical protein [Nocardioides sp.]|uniref:hypothetical protein n=1 Tax=Nocardioides sp. TaxID=35761 RepID=UPI002B27BDCC|nr:hypothetical protein [Nocardioides sp.]